MQKWWWVGLVVGWTMIGQRGEASVLIAQASCGGSSNVEMLQCARERYEASVENRPAFAKNRIRDCAKVISEYLRKQFYR